MADRFDKHSQNKSDPPSRGFSITPNDSTDLAQVTTCINVAASGVVQVTYLDDEDGTSLDLYVAAGIQFPGRFKRIWASNTTATGIVGSY